jgi:dUTP pyrophosphatase
MIRIARIRDVKLPCRKHPNDAGIDFYLPTVDDKFINDLKAKPENDRMAYRIDEGIIRMPAHSQALIPSGILYEIPMGHALIAFNKSGIATKKQVDVMASVGDESYQGELHLSIFNHKDEAVEFKQGDPVVQFLLIPVRYDVVEEHPIDQVFTRGSSSRGAGGFGSTGS